MCVFSPLLLLWTVPNLHVSIKKNLLLMMIGQIGGTLFTFIVALCKKDEKNHPLLSRMCLYRHYQQSVVFYVGILYPSHHYFPLFFSVFVLPPVITCFSWIFLLSPSLLYHHSWTLIFFFVVILSLSLFLPRSPIFSRFCLALISFCPNNLTGFSPFLYSDETWLHHPGR